MSLTRIAIEYDSDAGTATVRIDNGSQQWNNARLTVCDATETRDGYLLPISGQRRALILTGVPT
ncbi:hypothetical protein CN878_02860 [Ochrobactrum sp. 695/2009]|nr:hypothetical protein [Brucella intermedia]PJR89941.1 hypothetical protein CN881_12155 [Ochrobactrum sp. 721/2009]PJT14158.1 hypothetical protein CN880_21185 [Ochrobactrum sp. 720/2009]PJT24327.1 hypothetical protein CN879_08215 [Ochrobactrum sp. 715/2009]PJT30348.1 hypothetical protein CN878_02860 [Ochrobactrum sp. 695/2009]PJT33875.1 hypothetical protein CN877_09755 [Ochrobactrum sp. 689/2009]